MWIDTHCHPFAKQYNRDREAVIRRAVDAGVGRMIVVGYDKETNRQVMDLCEKYDFMYGALGVHPCDVPQLTGDELDWMRKTASSTEKIVAIGETGLDYYHNRTSKEDQVDGFIKHIALAKELSLPLIVHSRDSAEDTLRVLTDHDAKKVIFHCFTYDLEFAKKVWSRGYYTSFGGVVTYPKARDVQEAASAAPDDLFLIETDCPYLAPQSMRGKRNEMAAVVEVGKKIAELRGVSPEEIAALSCANAASVFGLV